MMAIRDVATFLNNDSYFNNQWRKNIGLLPPLLTTQSHPSFSASDLDLGCRYAALLNCCLGLFIYIYIIVLNSSNSECKSKIIIMYFYVTLPFDLVYSSLPL